MARKATSMTAAKVGHEAQLRQMADTLLPKLISGELRLKDAGNLIQETIE